LQGKQILVGVTGGIACYKVCDLVSKLRQKGADVHVVMTAAAQELVTPHTFKSLSGNPVSTELFYDPKSVPHINLADKADLVVIAPATANIIAKMAHGIADDLLSTLVLACKCPIIIAPAMNVNMYSNPIVQENLEKLKIAGVKTIGPNSGNLACGTSGKGRMAEPLEIFHFVEEVLHNKKDLEGRKILISAGGTREPIDPVRYIGNRSSGKMGYALANAASKRGAQVTLVTTIIRDVEPGINVIEVETAQEMHDEILSQSCDSDMIIMAAAVADFKPKNVKNEKIKKLEKEGLIIELERTPDILKSLGKNKRKDQILIGFAAETQNLAENALEKLKKKNLDMIVANDVTCEGAGFGSDTNIVTIYDKRGNQKEFPLLSKFEISNKILDYALQMCSG